MFHEFVNVSIRRSNCKLFKGIRTVCWNVRTLVSMFLYPNRLPLDSYPKRKLHQLIVSFVSVVDTERGNDVTAWSLMITTSSLFINFTMNMLVFLGKKVYNKMEQFLCQPYMLCSDWHLNLAYAIRIYKFE